jgi:hypothetical protein
MPKTPKHTPIKPKHEQIQETDPQSMERLDAALKKMLTTPHQTHKELVERRRRQGMRQSGRTLKK